MVPCGKGKGDYYKLKEYKTQKQKVCMTPRWSACVGDFVDMILREIGSSEKGGHYNWEGTDEEECSTQVKD